MDEDEKSADEPVNQSDLGGGDGSDECPDK
jgi:hypothetical protein